MIKAIRDRVKSISLKIAIAFFSASAIPLVIGLGYINHNARHQVQIEAENKLVDLVTSREQLLREHIENIQRYAESLAGFPTVVDALNTVKAGGEINDQTLVSAAMDITAMQNATWGKTHHIFLTDTQGTIILSPPYDGWDRHGITADQISDTQSKHYGDSIAGEDFFEDALLSSTVSGFFGFEEHDHYHQLALHPVRDEDGRTIGIICIEINIDTTLFLLMDNFTLGRSGHLFLATETGERVVHRKDDRDHLRHPSKGLTEAISSKRMISGRFKHEGTDVQGIYLPSNNFSWVVCIELDHDEIMYPVIAQQRQFTIVGGLILLLCGLTSIRVARILGSPIKELVVSANAVAEGDLLREIEITSTDEIGQLQGAVDEMRASLKQQIDFLDYTVEERTAELCTLNHQLKHDSEHDKLTNLANRDLLCRELVNEIEKYRADNSHLISVLFFDFDRFKLVNDSLGHAAGDALLCSIADRFRFNLRENDLPARFGGDEFVVLLSEVQSPQHAFDAAHRLLKLFEKHHVLDGHEITSTASIGIVTADMRYTNAEDMIRDADAAMYQAKLNGKGRVVRFDQEMLERSKFRLRVEEDLNKAIELRQLRVAYQPIINLETLKTAGFEALIRWEHPDLGWIRPDQFIDIAEDTGQIVKVGEWILEQAVAQIQEWNERFETAQKLSVNVNVSKRQLVDDGFMTHLRGVLSSSGINPAQLKIEITESTIVDPRSGECMEEMFREIQSIGVQVAMDDFGTGHSSLSLLHKYKFDVLKIDQSFIRDMDLNRDVGAVLHATIELAKNTGMAIVAEGVETESQVTSLIAYNCDMVQGYYFAKPMFAKDVVEFLRTPEVYRSAA